MTDIFGIAWEAELAYRRERISADFRQANGGRGRRRRWRARGREARVPARVGQAAAVGGGGGHVRR